MGIILFIFIFLIGLGSLSMMYCAFMIFRNNETYNVRNRILNERYELYKYLPTYDDMLYSFKPMKFEYWINYCEDTEFEQS